MAETATKIVKRYSVDVKKEALRLYFVEGYGYRRIAIRLNLSDPSLVRVWIYNYLRYGESWFRPVQERVPKLTSIDRLSVEQMQQEIVKLRRENVLLKKMRQTGEQNLMKKRRFELIHALQDEHDVKSLCTATDVSRSGYYRWKSRLGRTATHEIENQQILEKAKQVYEESHGTYGYRRIGLALRNEGIIVNHKRLQRILCDNDLQSSIRQHHVYKHPFRASGYCPNLLQQDFTASSPNQKWLLT